MALSPCLLSPSLVRPCLLRSSLLRPCLLRPASRPGVAS